MGLFDTVYVDEGIELPKFDSRRDPSELDWQTKDIGMPSMQSYRLTSDGRLLRKEVERREKTAEEKAVEAEEHGFESWDEYVSMCQEASPEELFERDLGIGVPRETVVDEEFWLDHNMHGTFEFHCSDDEADVGDCDGFFWSFEARFTRGQLDEIVFLGERGGGSDPDDLRPDAPTVVEY